MTRWQVLLLILSAMVLAMLLLIAKPATVLAPRTIGSSTPSPLVSVLLTGDIMLGRTVMTKSLDLKDPTYPFAKVAGVLRDADIVFGNLESPLIENCPREYTSLKFCAGPELVRGLTFAGIDVVSLANNHIANYGEAGITETKKILNENGVGWVGDGKVEVIEKGGKKFGFLGFDYVDILPAEHDFQLVRDLKSKVDVLIVGVHWGVEYTALPTKNEELIAKNLVEAGADVVVGTHPHWVQGIDHIGGKPVYYSLGNFVFDQMWSEETRWGLTIKLIFRDGKLVSEERMPVYIKDWAQPEFSP